jgi:hypothetical protein
VLRGHIWDKEKVALYEIFYDRTRKKRIDTGDFVIDRL